MQILRRRSNTATALTRTIKPLVASTGVKVTSNDGFACTTITGEIEQLMSARAFLSKDARFDVSEIMTYKAIPSCLYVTLRKNAA